MTEWGRELSEEEAMKEHAVNINVTSHRKVAVSLLAVTATSNSTAGVVAAQGVAAAAQAAVSAEAAVAAEAAAAMQAAAQAEASAEAAATAEAFKVVTGTYHMQQEEKAPANQTVVWITSFPRSGSTTGLNMFAYPSAKNNRAAFSVFEPCHGLAPPGSNEVLEREGCQKELTRIAKCDYGKLRTIGSWAKKDGGFIFAPTPDGLHHEPPHVQSGICRRSDVIAFKTVTYGQDVEHHVLPLLDTDPRVRVIAIVRDPRGIYASWRTTEPFADVIRGDREMNLETHDQDWAGYGLKGICDAFARNMALPHNPRIFTMKYEDLVAEPMDTVKKIYEHVGIPFGESEINWVKSTFDANCKDEEVGQFSTCHRNSAAPVLRWREVLSHEEQADFAGHPACREVAEHYGYPI